MKIKDISEEKKISQKALATLLGVSPTNIYNYEAGRTEPSIDMLKKIADVLSVSIDTLVGRADEFGNVNVITNGVELSSDEKTLLNCYRKLGVFEREAILIQIKALAGNLETIKK